MGCSMSQEGAPPEDAYYKNTNNMNGTVLTTNADMTDEYFTQHQKKILRETWKVISKDSQETGIQIFIQIFERKPVTKQLFPFRDLEGEELLKNAMFRSHAKRFMHAVETTIVNIDALEVALIPVLHRLGEKHVWIDGFKEEYLAVFMSSVVDVFMLQLGKEGTNQVRDAWCHLAKFIADIMNQGYHQTLKDKNQNGNGNVPCSAPTNQEQEQEQDIASEGSVILNT